MKFRDFDLFSKVSSDHTQKTISGGLMSIIFYTVVFALFFSEIYTFFSFEVEKSTEISQINDEGELWVNMNVSLPAIPCGLVSLDHQDTIGAHTLNITEGITKTRISSESQRMGQIHWNYTHVKTSIASNEGCEITGFFPVKKVPGNFHISFHGVDELLFFLLPDELKKLHFSHVINHLSFGIRRDNYYVGKVFGDDGEHADFAPFDGLVGDQTFAGSTEFNYDIDILPIVYDDQRYSKVTTSYHFNMHSSQDQLNNAPYGAIYFRYNIENIIMTYRIARQPWIHFIISLCAIAGGAFAILKLINTSFLLIKDKQKQSPQFGVQVKMVDPFNMVAPEASQDSGLKPDVTEFNALTCELEYTRRPVQKLPCLPKASSMFLPESINPTGNHRKIVSNSTLTILALDSELLIITGSEGKLSSFPMKSTVVEISLHPSKNLLACILLEGVMVVLDLDKMEEKERKEEKCSRIIWLQGMKFATYYGSKISYWQMVGNGYTLSKTRECGTTLHDFCIPDETVACVILANGKFQIRSTETSANEILYELEVSQAQLATIRPGYFLLLESGKITLWNTEQQKFTSMLTISDSNGLKCINWVNEADLLVLTHTNSPRVTFLYLDSISFRYAVEYSLEDNTIGAAARFARSNKSGELMNQDCEIEVIGIHGENLTNYKINYGALFPCLANDYVPTAAGLIVTEEIKEEMEDKGYETTLFRPIPTVFNQLLHSPSVDEATPQVTSPPETITPPIALPSMTPVITPPYQEPPKETTPILPPIQPTTPPKPSEDQAPKEPLKHLPSSATGSDSNISPRPKPKKVAPPINERQIEKKLEQAQRKIEQNIQTKLQEQMNMLQEHMNSFGSQIKTTIGNEIKIQFQTYVLPKLDETIQLQSGQMKSKFENSVLELGERSDERWGVIEQITKHFKSSVEVLIDINKGISSALDTRKESESSKSESPAAEPQTLEQRVISLLQAQKFEDGINLALEDTTILLKVLGWIEANSLLSGNFLSNDTFWALLETLLGLADDSSSLAMDWLEQLSFHIQIRKEDGPRLDAIIQQLYAWTGEGKTKIWEIRMRLISKFPE